MEKIRQVGKKYQQNLRCCILNTNNSYDYLVNIESSILLFLKTYSTEFSETIIIFADQNGRPLRIEDKVNLKLLIKK